MRGFAVTKLPDPSWGEPTIARAVGSSQDPWGVLSVLKDTAWESLFPEVPSSVFDQALRGHATPLMRVLGPPPAALLRRVPVIHTACREREACINASPLCRPGPKMPDCWDGEGIDQGAREVASYVARLWRDGVPVIVVIPGE